MIPCRACGGSPGAPRVGWRYDEECRACGAYGIYPGGPVADAPANVARRPVAGWKRPRSNRWTLDVGYLRATVDVLGDGRIVWRVSYFTDDAEHVKASSADDGAAYSVTTASTAAEDALRAVLVDAAAVLGLRVVPS